MTTSKKSTDNKAAGIGDVMQQAKGLLAVNPIMAPQFEQFWKMQENVLQEAEAFSRGWFQRRHEAAKSALEATRGLNGNGAAESPSALQAITDWNRHSMERMTEDFQEWMKFCTQCAGHLSAAEAEAGKQELEEARKHASAAGKAKHSNPV